MSSYPLPSVSLLRKDGHDVVSISELSPGISDEEVMKIASSENRVLLTFDKDYGELIFLKKLRAPNAVVYLRFMPVDPLEPGIRMQEFFGQLNRELSGSFWVVTRGPIRRRPLVALGEDDDGEAP